MASVKERVIDIVAEQLGVSKDQVTSETSFVNDLGGCMLFIGVVMALFRRYFTKPEVLPQNAFSGRVNLFGDTGILIFLLLLIVTGFLSEGARLAVDNPEAAGFSWLGYPISKIAMESTWVNLQPSLWWGHAVIYNEPRR